LLSKARQFILTGLAALGFARHKDTLEAYGDIDFSTL
jgi:hypothetical protein